MKLIFQFYEGNQGSLPATLLLCDKEGGNKLLREPTYLDLLRRSYGGENVPIIEFDNSNRRGHRGT